MVAHLLLAAGLVAWAVGTKPDRFDDGHEYLLMTKALARHRDPVLTPDVLAAVQTGADLRGIDWVVPSEPAHHRHGADDPADGHAVRLPHPPAGVPRHRRVRRLRLFRYLYLMHTRDAGEQPEEVLLADRPTLVNIVLWAVTSAAMMGRVGP